MTNEFSGKEKIRISFTSFLSSLFASLIPGMKRSQAAVIALEGGRIGSSEERLFALSVVSLSCMVLSILVLDSTGSVRSNLAYEIKDLVGDLFFSKTLLLIGSIILAASFSSTLMFLISNPLNRILSKVEKKYLKVFGFGLGLALIIYFTGWEGLLLAFTASCIGIMAILLRVKSTHLMGVLLLPSIIVMVM
jgi:putative membrane protein